MLYHQEMLVNMNFWLAKILFLPEKELLEKAVALKRFEYSLLGKELKKQTRVIYWETVSKIRQNLRVP